MSQSKYPLVEKLGVCVHETWMGGAFPVDYVIAVKLEECLQKATRVYKSPSRYGWDTLRKNGDTLTGLLIAVEDIPKEPIKIELVGRYESLNWEPCQKLLGRRVKVTFEEIVE